ncbi:MAG TPA: CAP domain-containing protein, partial [Ilumatobacteraceae bacterium]|nr:CAP domain-containing protein [Ilumatobacteraceae bacterium]
MPASAASPPFISPDADWLTTVNYFRAMAFQGPVTENTSWSAGAYNHSCYMLQNGITHTEVAGKPGYTPSGDTAGRNSNVAVSSVYGASARSHIELWMTGPFHAIGVLRPGLTSVGFGKCDMTNPGTNYRSGATLNVLSGLGPSVPQASPILFPGNGTTTSLNMFRTESPNPAVMCGWGATTAGLPVVAMMPEGFSGVPVATMIGASTGPQQVCVLSGANANDPNDPAGTAKSILNGVNGVVVMPRNTLAPDTYSVTITTSSRTVTWSFTVDPTAATGLQPVPVTQPLDREGATLKPVSPVRVVDTRSNLGTSKLFSGIAKRVQITGRGSVPVGASAVSANFTITNAQAGGYLTVWNCSTDRPVVSTLNYSTTSAVPNGASVPLDTSGGLCVFSSATADLVVDVNGYYDDGGDGRFSSVSPARLMDTRETNSRLGKGEIRQLRVAGVASVPFGAEVVSLNVTSVAPDYEGYVTVWPCDVAMPTASSVNPVPGAAKPNVVLAPVAADGTVCFFASTPVDIVVDITGYVASSASLTYVPATPFRLTDTR